LFAQSCAPWGAFVTTPQTNKMKLSDNFWPEPPAIAQPLLLQALIGDVGVENAIWNAKLEGVVIRPGWR